MPFCRKCWNEVKEDALFCNKCGSPVNPVNDYSSNGNLPINTPISNLPTSMQQSVWTSATETKQKSSKGLIVGVVIVGVIFLAVLSSVVIIMLNNKDESVSKKRLSNEDYYYVSESSKNKSKADLEELNAERIEIYNKTLKDIWTYFAKEEFMTSIGDERMNELLSCPYAYFHWNSDEYEGKILSLYKYAFEDITGDGLYELIVFVDDNFCYLTLNNRNEVVKVAYPKDVDISVDWPRREPVWGWTFGMKMDRVYYYYDKKSDKYIFYQMANCPVGDYADDYDGPWSMNYRVWEVSEDGLSYTRLPGLYGTVDDHTKIYTQELTGTFGLDADFDDETINDKPLSAQEAIEMINNQFSHYQTPDIKNTYNLIDFVPYEN